MASKPVNPQPLQLPNLGDLPDPFKDLMGTSAANPAEMMMASQKEYNDFFSPKAIEGNYIKPSATAAQVLAAADSQVKAQIEAAAERQREYDKQLAQQRQEEARRIEEYKKQAEKLRKEQEKALKEKKKEQGGKLGAAPDGSFLADTFVKNITSDKGWNDIVSTLERNDVMEAELAKFEAHLRNSNVADDIIEAELKRARTGISSHTKQYEKEFTKDGLELTDLGVAIGKTATNLASYAALLGTSTGVGKAVTGIIKSVSGRDIQTDTVNMLVDARNAIDNNYSGTLKLRRANDQYTMEKAKREAGGELSWADEASTTIKSMWDNDMGVYYAIEAVPDLLGSAGAGFAGKLLLKGGAKVAGRVASKEIAETTAMKNLAKIVSGTMTTKSKIADFALKGLSVPGLAANGYGMASTMASTATDTYDTIRHTDSEVLAKHYGRENWNALVSEVGEQKAKEILATQAARDAASNVGPVALLTSMFGLEGAIGGLITKRAAAEVVERVAVSKTKTAANLVGATALGAGTEALEEGYTQYSSNVAMNPLTGVDPMDGVASAAASGAYVGGVLNGAVKAADIASTYHAINSLNNISADKGFTTNADGTVTFDSNAFKSAMGEAFAIVNKVHRDGHGSFSDGKAATQAYYDRIFDNDERYQTYATPEQKADVRKFARENYGVNTNNFTFFDDNETSTAFKSDDIERVRATGNELLLDSYRIKHGVELDQVNPENAQVAKAIARSIDHVSTLDPNLNTFQREHEFQKFIENDLSKDASLDAEDRAAIAQFMGTHYGTRAARMTDEEQRAYDEQVKQYQASQQENADGPVSEANATDGAGSSRQTGGQPTQDQDTEVGADGQQVPPQSDTQSPRNAGTRQTDNSSPTTDVPTEPNQADGGPNAGATEVQNTRNTSNPTSPQTGGGTPTQNGNTGQADQSGQSARPSNTTATQTPTGGRSTRATTAERRADNGSDQAATEAIKNALRDGIRPVTAKELKQADKAIQKILKTAKVLKGKHTYDKDKLELWVTASATHFAELNYGIPATHKTNLDDKRNNNSNLRNTAIAAILAFRENGGKAPPLQSKTKRAAETVITSDDSPTQISPADVPTDPIFTFDENEADELIDKAQSERLIREALSGIDEQLIDESVSNAERKRKVALRKSRKQERAKFAAAEAQHRADESERLANAKRIDERINKVLADRSAVVGSEVTQGRAAHNLNRRYKENDILTAREQAKADTKLELKNATDDEVLTAALLDNPQNGFGKSKNPFAKGLDDLLFRDARFERVKDRDKRGDGYRYVKRPQQEMLDRLFVAKERQQGRWEAIQDEMAKRGLDKNKPANKSPDEAWLDAELNSVESPLFLRRRYKNEHAAGVLVKQGKQYKFIPFNDDYRIAEVGNTSTTTPLRDLGFSLFNGSVKTNLGLSADKTDKTNATINGRYRAFNQFISDVLNFEPTQDYIDNIDEDIEQALDPRFERDYEAELDAILDLLSSVMGDNADIERLITGYADADFDNVLKLQDTDPELYMEQMNDTLIRYAEAFEQAEAEQAQRNAIAGYIGYTGDVDGAKDLFGNSVANGDTPRKTAEEFDKATVQKINKSPKGKSLSSKKKQNANQMSLLDVIEATDKIIEENSNAKPNRTTANDTSQAETDSPATGDANPKNRTRAKAASTKTKTEASPQEQSYLAPNGKPSNLSPELYDYVRTEEFKEWFGDWENNPQSTSKIVDENGEPLVVYRGTPEIEGDQIITKDGGSIFFTNDPFVASTYHNGTSGGTTTSYFIKSKNPFVAVSKNDALHTEAMRDAKIINGYIDDNSRRFYSDKLESFTSNIFEDAKSNKNTHDGVIVVDVADNGFNIPSKKYGSVKSTIFIVQDRNAISKPLDTIVNEKSFNDRQKDNYFENIAKAIPFNTTQFNPQEQTNATQDTFSELTDVDNIEAFLKDFARTALYRQSDNFTQQFADLQQAGKLLLGTTDDKFRELVAGDNAFESGNLGYVLNQLGNNILVGRQSSKYVTSEQLSAMEQMLSDIVARALPIAEANPIHDYANLTEARKILGHKQTDERDPYGYKDRYSEHLLKNLQEQTNATQENPNGKRPAEQTTDENGQNTVRNDDTTNEQSREVPRQSGQTVGEQSQESGTETTQQLKKGHELIQDYLNNNPQDHEAVQSYFAEQKKLAQLAYAGTALTEQIINNYNLFNGSEIDFIEKMLGDRPFTDENIAQVIDGAKTIQTSGISFDSLPTPVKNVLKKIWDKIKSTAAAISMALAIATGTTLTIPTEANAATPIETAVVQNIVKQNDNQSKPFIVADKQAGTLTVYTPSGKVVTTTPALFGKATGDSISINNTTPSGRYDMNLIDGSKVEGKGYGSSVQALSVNGKLQENNAGNIAIHRVLPIENRQGRLVSPTASDNRISHGCINVPSDFYDTHLDSEQDTVVYVMPETNAGKTGVFNTPNVTAEKPTSAKDGYANAKTNTVEMTADEVTKAVNDSSQKVAKATTPQVLTIANTKPTAQIALVNSVVLPQVDVAATRMAVIQGQYTPAEQKANDKFDTEPVKEKYDGVGLSDIAVAIEIALAGLAGGVALTAGRRGRGRSDTDTDTQTTTEPPVDDTPDETQVETPADDLPNDIDDIVIDDPQDVELDDTMDSQYSEFVANSGGILLSEEEQQELNQALGLETIASEFDKSVAELQAYTERVLNGTEPVPNKLKSKKTATASGVKQAMKPPRTAPQIAIDRALMIRAMNNDPNISKTWVTMASTAADILDEQLNNAHFNRVQGSETRQWKFVGTKKNDVGLLGKLFNVLGGATPLLDTIARNNNIAAVGYEADSNVLSTSLAGIKMRRTGAFSVLSNRYLDPLNREIHKLSYRTKVAQDTLREDLGELANARHVLDEAYAYHVKDLKEQIDIAQTAINSIQSEIAKQNGATAEQANDLSIVNKHLDELNTEFKLIDDTYNGKIAWDKSKVKLPGGRVKAEWDKIISDAQAKYGENYDSLVALSDDIYNALTETRKYAAAHGVYNNEQLASISSIGFKKYVPLYKKEKTADEVLSSHPDDEVQLSLVAKALAKYSNNYRGFAVSQTRDLTRYHRQGATSPADNAYNNLEAYLLNTAGRIAEQPFREVLQQAYEGTTYTPYSASAVTNPETLAELNTHEGSKFSGLIRVPVGGLTYLPNSLKERIKAPNGVEYVKPIRAKGYDKDGNLVDFDYYFTDKAVRDEIYSNVDFSLEFDNLAVNGLSRLTRFQSGLFTRYNPMWNVWNYMQDSAERISNMLFREVRDKDGNRINRTKVAGAYVKSLSVMTANPYALFEILQYMHDDTKLETPLQRLLHEAKRSGSISLITSLTKRNSALQDLRKSDLTRIAETAKNKLGIVVDSNAVTHYGAKLISVSTETYFNVVVELPQILTTLAAYEAYKSVGVNQVETANRVRDQFDPFRTQNSLIKKASVMYPFVRAAGAGGYNLLRTLTQYWGKGDRLGTVLTLAAGAAIMYGLQAMALAALGYDDDDEPYAKRLSAADLSRGIPLMGSKGDVLFFPVGFGLNALIASISANIHSMQMGQQSGTEAMMNVAGSITHNLSPVTTGSSASWAKDPTAAAVLTLSPTIVQPLVEIATNTDAFTARDIYRSKTPKNERDSEQGGANVPEKYKDYAKSIYTVGLDVRPETIQHLAENYLVGPLKAITADVNDRADKTLGAESTKGEYYGTFATAMGLDLKRSHTALSDTNYSYKMLDLQSKILKSYNVPTSHAAEDYEEFDINRRTEGAAALTASKLRAAGASENEISFVLNAMEFNNARENINRDYNKAKVKLVRNQAEGADTSKYIDTYEQVQEYSSAVFDLTKTYVSENRELYDEMLQQYE